MNPNDIIVKSFPSMDHLYAFSLSENKTITIVLFQKNNHAFIWLKLLLQCSNELMTKANHLNHIFNSGNNLKIPFSKESVFYHRKN